METVRRSISLHRFVYRTLTIRLALMALVAGLVAAAAVYVAEEHTLGAQVAEETHGEVRLLAMRTQWAMRESGIDRNTAFVQALDERVANRHGNGRGEYVYVRFSLLAAPESLERRDTGYALADEVLRFIHARPRPSLETGETAEMVFLGDRMQVYAVVPLLDQDQRIVGHVQVVFAPSEATLSTMAATLRRAVLLTLLIVLATSGLLYPVIVHLVGRLSLFSRNLLEANLETLSLLASAIAKRDSDTDMHNFRVTLCSVRLGEAMQLDDDGIRALIKGAFLHDVGKIGVRDNILLKAGALAEEEFDLMKDHVRHGLDIVRGSAWLRDAIPVVASHHEKFDGSGYPQGLAGASIPLLARIFAVADVFDALVSRRPYKQPLSFAAAMTVVRQGRGRHFDPAVLDAFESIAPKFHRFCVTKDDGAVRAELGKVIVRYFSEGAVLLY
jgi:HD-GYP domain-containing protein (c-di-GMP phosphodiesterase class II)